jgi:fructose-1,6-bisphosphatase/inositol monophosphatase family enzyme
MDNTDGISVRLTPDQIEAALTVVQDVFKNFRPAIMERAGKSAYTNKPDGSEVTETDVEVEQTLQAEMAKRFPGMRVYGEESGYESHLSGAFWLVDPIDGTKSFIANVPTFTSMAVLIQDDDAVACVIYNPSLDDMYVAQKDMGATRNGQRLDLSAVPLPAKADCKTEFIDALDAMLEPKSITCEVAPAGCGDGHSKVAAGERAARFNMHSRGYTHDYAPGALLVREAGGAIVPIKEDVYTYETRSYVACHPALEALVRSHLAELRKLDV